MSKGINEVHQLVLNEKYEEALNRFRFCEQQEPQNQVLKLEKCGIFIDIGCSLKDQYLIEQGIKAGEENFGNEIYAKYRKNLAYHLANGYFSLFLLFEKGKNAGRIIRSESLQKAKKYFRIALNNRDGNSIECILVNFGNCLSNLGRAVEAISLYNEALKINKNFSMAIGNRAKTLRYFADISGKYREGIYIQAYQDLESIINEPDVIKVGGLLARQGFERELEAIEKKFKNKDVLKRKIKHKRYHCWKLSKFEKFYLDFCSKNKLFLNFHIHQDLCQAAVSDPIFISLITKIEDNTTFYNLAEYINQIKEDFIVSRLLLTQSQFKKDDLNRISERTSFVNTLECSQFSLYSGLLKSSFQEAFNILDKIGVFINDYFNLGLPLKGIYFTSVWKEEGKLREIIEKTENISLFALYDIVKDFESKYYRRVEEIRNAITHRKLVISDDLLVSFYKKDVSYYIGCEAMTKETINLLQLVKAAIIYLVNFVAIEEKKKLNNGKSVPILVSTNQYLKGINDKKI